MRKKVNLLLLMILLSLVLYTIFSCTNPQIPFTEKRLMVNIKLDKENIILVNGESVDVISSHKDTKWKSMDEGIAIVNNGQIKAVGAGETTIEASYRKSKALVHVLVTDLITLPIINNKKPYLKCNQFSEEEAASLDALLEYRIAEAGLKTRAGAVAAARFLTLEFPFRISYFYENGRLLTNNERPYVDGEGRYYHKGLFLSESKIKDLKKSMHGPAIWGCPLYSRITNAKSANGLDCSGYVSWALFNAGFDVGDGGAGINANKDNDLDDLGEKLLISKENIKDERIKVGDLLSRHGHIGILIGKDDEHYYIAESLTNDIHVLTLTSKELLSSDWKYIILMDSVYKKDGQLTNMW